MVLFIAKVTHALGLFNPGIPDNCVMIEKGKQREGERK
jgi:hypothetical protein